MLCFLIFHFIPYILASYTGIFSGLQARNLETSLNDKLAASGRTVTPGDLYAVTVRRGKYQDGVPYQAGQKIQPTGDGSVTHILEAFGASDQGKTINFRRITDEVLRKMERGAAEGENVAEVAGDGDGSIIQSIDKETHYVLFNKAHKDSLPIPKGIGPNGGRLQSHHGIQKEWAIDKLRQYNYDPELAPTITIETGTTLPHTIICNRQNMRRRDRINKGLAKWGSTINEELQYMVDDLVAVGFSRKIIDSVLEQQYKMLDKLGVIYERIDE